MSANAGSQGQGSKPRRGSLVDEIRQAVGELEHALGLFEDALAQVGPAAKGMTMATIAEVTVLIRQGREAASKAKVAGTRASSEVEDIFCSKIAETGDTVYRTDTHSFSASAKGFFGVPSPRTKPQEFKLLLHWLETNGHSDMIEVDGFGGWKIDQEKFADICQTALDEGNSLPPGSKEHLVPAVRVTKLRSVRP